MRSKTVSRQILKVTDGLVGTVTNFILLNLYFLASVGGVKTMGDANRVARDVHRMLDTVNYDTIKRAVGELRKQGLITKSKRDTVAIAITKLGLARIKETIPTYRNERPWDGHIYLISYDIPEASSTIRDLLRQYIRRTGGALLQESLWINPYNPTLLLEEFTKNHGITGTILISKLGHDGTVGEETLPDLIARVYTLNELAERYEEFVTKGEHPMEYLAILKTDPQLPFPLLPEDFPAEAAWKRYQTLIAKNKR